MFGHRRRLSQARYEQASIDAPLRDELLAMVAAEDALEDDLRATGSLTRQQAAIEHPEFAQLQAPHAERIWELLDDLEVWPGRRLVGADGTTAAWHIVMRARRDVDLQRRALEHLEIAVEFGDAEPFQFAMLDDRIAMAEGRPQRYGTQLVTSADGASLEPWPIDDPEGLDSRRRRVGLEPLAEQLARMHARYAKGRAPQ